MRLSLSVFIKLLTFRNMNTSRIPVLYLYKIERVKSFLSWSPQFCFVLDYLKRRMCLPVYNFAVRVLELSFQILFSFSIVTSAITTVRVSSIAY